MNLPVCLDFVQYELLWIQCRLSGAFLIFARICHRFANESPIQMNTVSISSIRRDWGRSCLSMSPKWYEIRLCIRAMAHKDCILYLSIFENHRDKITDTPSDYTTSLPRNVRTFPAQSRTAAGRKLRQAIGHVPRTESAQRLAYSHFTNKIRTHLVCLSDSAISRLGLSIARRSSPSSAPLS